MTSFIGHPVDTNARHLKADVGGFSVSVIASELLILVISCLHSYAYDLFLFYHGVSCFRGSKRIALSLILIFFRGILSAAVAASSSIDAMRLLVIMALSLAAFVSHRKARIFTLRMRIFIASSAYLTMYMIIASLMFSFFPFVSIAKWITYIIPFIAVMVVVWDTSYECDWIKLVSLLFTCYFLASVPLIWMGQGYLRNGHAFQGICNHPNIFGVTCALCFAVLIYQVIFGKASWLERMMIVLVVALELLSESRTGFISIVVIGIVALATSRIGARRIPKEALILTAIMAVILLALLPLFDYGETVVQFVGDYLSKGGTGLNMDSRLGTLDQAVASFKYNPVFGTGFLTPWEYGQVKSYVFSVDLVVEPGNLLFAIIGETGIAGMLVFSIYYGSILLKSKKDTMCLALAPFLVSMGEMTFFSTNNCGIILYFLIACAYISGEPNTSHQVSEIC